MPTEIVESRRIYRGFIALRLRRCGSRTVYSLRILAEDLSRRRFGSGAAVKGAGAYTAEVRGSNPLRSTRKSPQAGVISYATGHPR